MMDDRKVILVVDDDRAVRDAYKEILAPRERDFVSEGDRLFGEGENKTKPIPVAYSIEEARDGNQAVLKVREAVEQGRPFSVAFVDMKMPGMNGAETAREIWRIDPRIKIMIVTAYSDVTPTKMIDVVDREDLFYLRKPFNPLEIQQFARAMSRQWTLESERDRLVEELKDANLSIEAINRDLEKKVRTQAEVLIQSEKMASLGVLSASVVHEINNPLSYIKSNLSVMQKYVGILVALLRMYEALTSAEAKMDPVVLKDEVREVEDFKERNKTPFILADLPGLVEESLEGTARIESIVNDLRAFSRVDEGDRKEVDISDVVESALKIVRHELKNRVEVVTDYRETPAVSCSPQKLIQAFLNIILNAVYAIEKEGTIRITTRHIECAHGAPGAVEVTISDTGCGVPKQNVTKIFEPFFSTKPAGRGVGLGLYITHEIIQSHGGTISVQSLDGNGAAFMIRIPLSMAYQPVADLK
jgi:two-component system, NtrC family, sensor kinase